MFLSWLFRQGIDEQWEIVLLVKKPIDADYSALTKESKMAHKADWFCFKNQSMDD